MRILFPWEDGYQVQRAAFDTAASTGAPVALPKGPWDGTSHSLAHRRETVNIQQGQLVNAGYTPDRARELSIDAAKRYDRRN